MLNANYALNYEGYFYLHRDLHYPRIGGSL